MLTLAVCLGGMIGGWGRYRLASWVYARAGPGFPWGTLAVNLSGSLLVGLVLPAVEGLHGLPLLRSFLIVGVFGAFTTFSTFAFEAVMLLEDGQRKRAAAYAGASLTLGLLAIAAGLTIGLRIA